LAGVNAPELKAKEESVKIKANESRQYLVDSIVVGSEVLIKSRELDKYGRPVIDLYYGEGFSRHLNKEVLEKGLAVKFM
jgi:endonuclease YncB( thermonuclease family)